MVLSTAHGASTLFVTEWNDAVYAIKYMDSTVDHGRYSSAANSAVDFDATSTAHGLLKVLSGTSTTFLDGDMNWTSLTNEVFRAYTTGTATTMFSALSTYVSGGGAAASSWAYLLYYIQVPQFVAPSRIDFTMSCAACSSNTASSCVVLVCDVPPNVGGVKDFVTTATLSTKKSDTITGYFPTTSNWATFTTQFRIVGGQAITIWALSTTAPVLKVKDIYITGVVSTAVYAQDAWGAICGSTQT
jgi:hypothetical protein